MTLNSIYVDNLIKTALLEDINYLDTTTDYLIDENQENTAIFLAKSSGVLCGIEVALRVFEILQPNGFEAKVYKHDGDKLVKGEIIAEIHGKTRTILKGERTALNLIQHMSGIATATNKAVEIVSGTKASIADTRKTLPGMRPLQKYAVTVGGGRNHRYNLSDAAMLKDNHIGAAGGVAKAVAMAKAYAPFVRKIEIEVENLDQTREAVEAGADIIMLDNMSDADMRAAVQLIAGRAQTECSGNVTKENIARLKDIGVDFVSSGALTHSAPILDLSMKHLRPLDKEEA
jgi:nicotinate-nucleotide pyrophosphorylase (carboxylating)